MSVEVGMFHELSSKLLLQSEKTQVIEKNARQLPYGQKKDKVEEVYKPLFTQNLTKAIQVYFLGIDQQLGILVSDETHAISCHLKSKALK